MRRSCGDVAIAESPARSFPVSGSVNGSTCKRWCGLSPPMRNAQNAASAARTAAVASKPLRSKVVAVPMTNSEARLAPSVLPKKKIPNTPLA